MAVTGASGDRLGPAGPVNEPPRLDGCQGFKQIYQPGLPGLAGPKQIGVDQNPTKGDPDRYRSEAAGLLHVASSTVGEFSRLGLA